MEVIVKEEESVELHVAGGECLQVRKDKTIEDMWHIFRDSPLLNEFYEGQTPAMLVQEILAFVERCLVSNPALEEEESG